MILLVKNSQQLIRQFFATDPILCLVFEIVGTPLNGAGVRVQSARNYIAAIIQIRPRNIIRAWRHRPKLSYHWRAICSGDLIFCNGHPNQSELITQSFELFTWFRFFFVPLTSCSKNLIAAKDPNFRQHDLKVQKKKFVKRNRMLAGNLLQFERSQQKIGPRVRGHSCYAGHAKPVSKPMHDLNPLLMNIRVAPIGHSQRHSGLNMITSVHRASPSTGNLLRVGVVVDLEMNGGTGAGRSAQDAPEIGFRK